MRRRPLAEYTGLAGYNFLAMVRRGFFYTFLLVYLREELGLPVSLIAHKVSASLGGAFTLRKLVRKARGLWTLYRRHLRWYQWPVLLLAQPLLLVMAAVRVFFAPKTTGDPA